MSEVEVQVAMMFAQITAVEAQPAGMSTQLSEFAVVVLG